MGQAEVENKKREAFYSGAEATGERYLPEKAIKALSSSEYAATTSAKRRAIRKGKQFSKQPRKVARKTARYRKT